MQNFGGDNDLKLVISQVTCETVKITIVFTMFERHIGKAYSIKYTDIVLKSSDIDRSSLELKVPLVSVDSKNCNHR